jgi:hypothetical protein
MAPLSSVLVRMVGMKLLTAAGLFLVAAGLWLQSGSAVTWTYRDMLPGLVLTGVGAALVMPTVSGSVMGSVPRGNTAVASATNGTFMQFGGALGVAVIGSLMSTRYQDRMAVTLNHRPVPAPVRHAMLSSIGEALAIASRLGGTTTDALVRAARAAFLTGADLGLAVAAVAALAGCILTLAALPRRPPEPAPADEVGRDGKRTRVHEANR